MHQPGHGSPAQALLALRIIGASLGVGVTLFVGVGWLVRRQGGPSFSLGDPATATYVCIGLTFVAALAALAVWRTRVGPVLEHHPRGDWAERATAIQTPVIITWAILEAGALAGAAAFFLYGTALAAVLGLALMWGGLAVTWPRPDWFGA